MAKTLIADHAEDVGGQIVEPGQKLPADADPDVVQRLEDDGKLGEPESAAKSKKGE